MSDDLRPNSTSSPQPDWYSARLARRMERRMERMQHRMERRAARYAGGGAWLAGAVLIIIGVILMLQNMGAMLITNWWALFLLLPAAASFATAIGAYRNNDGQLARHTMARGALISGLVWTAAAVFFLLDLDWEKLWPLLLILAGVGALTNSVLPE